jgi:hypothetical protein
MTYAVYMSALLALWSIARQYPARRKPLDAGPPSLGGWDLAAERE